MASIADVNRRKGTATRVLNTEIRKEIIRQDAVDTGRMRNVSKIVRLKWDESTDDMSMEIDSTYYYKFVDEGFSRKWKSGKIKRNITKAFMKREKVIDQLEKVVEVIIEYRIDQEFR
jgi:ribonuclease HI